MTDWLAARFGSPEPGFRESLVMLGIVGVVMIVATLGIVRVGSSGASADSVVLDAPSQQRR